ncbi:MAG: hypothetical protein ACRDHD_03785 [Candidatus Limnocylindria bacterium]
MPYRARTVWPESCTCGTGMQVRLILVGVLIAQLGDAATFVVGQALHGIGLESNGLAVMAFQAGGVAGVLLAKGAVIGVVLLVLATTAHRFPRLMVWGGATGTALGLLGVLANVTSLMLLA